MSDYSLPRIKESELPEATSIDKVRVLDNAGKSVWVEKEDLPITKEQVTGLTAALALKADQTELDQLAKHRNNTITVAAYDSDTDAKVNADIVASDLASGIAAINSAITLLGNNGGRVFIRVGTYNGSGFVDLNKPNIVIEGESTGAYINRTSEGNDIIVNAENAIIKNIKTKSIARNCIKQDCIVDSILSNTGNSYNLLIAASDSPANIKRVADVVCTGVSDQVIINTAIAGISISGGRVKLSAGNYYCTGSINISKSNLVLEGDRDGTIINFSETYTDPYGIITINNSENTTVIGLNVGEKNIILESSGSGRVYNCTYLGSYKLFSKLPELTGLNTYDFLIAAHDAPQKYKNMADYICTGTNDETLLYIRISNLTNGGVIRLSPGTYNFGAYLSVRRSGITIIGSGYSTVINRTAAPLCIGTVENAQNVVVMDVNCGTNTINLQQQGGSGYVYRCWEAGGYTHQKPNELGTIFVPAVRGIDGIRSAITSLGSTGGKILLQSGVYEGSSGVDFTGSNVILEGQGKTTVIKRSSGLDIFSNTASARDNIVKNVSCYNNIQKSGEFPTQRVRYINCWVDGRRIDQSADGDSIRINIGKDYYFNTISSPYGAIYLTNWHPENRFEFHIWGHIIETEKITFSKGVDIIGHNALLELKGYKSVYAEFRGVWDGYGDGYIVKDIHFIKTGCYNFWDSPAVSVSSNNAKFYNCIFENASSSPSPFNQGEQGRGLEDFRGSRRHGIYVYSSGGNYGRECRTEFHNCTAIGSMYGFQNTRGWYILGGSPKLYNCIGYGGGIGEYGHGLVSHRGSRAELINFIGYASKTAYRQAAGIRFQAAGSSQLIGCIGYGGNGVQMISYGIPEQTILDYCTSLGITDTSFLYNEGVFDYDGLTIKSTDDGYNASRQLLCSSFKNEDIVLAEVGSGTIEGYGISMWVSSGKPKLINCIGYSGSGDGSHGLHIISRAKPIIQGGYFGIEDKMEDVYIVKDAGQLYMKHKIDENHLNQFTPYSISGITLSITNGGWRNPGDKLYVETDEAIPKLIVDGYEVYGVASIGILELLNTDVDAGVGLKIYVKNEGSFVNFPDSSLRLHIIFNYNQANASALYLGDSAAPQIQGSHIESSKSNVAVELATDSDDYLINYSKIITRGDSNAISVSDINHVLKIFDCYIKGGVDASIQFAPKVLINGSSNYKK